MKERTAARLRVENVLRRLTEMLPGKVDAYGAAHELQPRLLAILLEQYRQERGAGLHGYQLPSHVAAQIPRVTRCLDRIIRIMSAPAAGDLLGESPWLDLAGDAIAGQATADLAAETDKVMSTGPMPPYPCCTHQCVEPAMPKSLWCRDHHPDEPSKQPAQYGK